MEKEKQIAVNSTTTNEAKVTLHAWLKRNNNLLSTIVDERISNADTLRMCNVTIAFVAMILSANYFAMTSVVSMAWLITAIIDFKTNLQQ